MSTHIPSDLKYVASHEWLRVEADGSVTVGITDHAQSLLGDVVFVEVPKVGAQLAADEQAGVVESVKSASDVYAPIAGEILAVNESLADATESVNTDPYGAGWFFKIKPANPADLDGLMDAAAYGKEIGA
ncbi:glycine cleavage system protein GcvH [Chitinimonas viridis]|uniref:Glycine cleavage system H protein n=2 Tax=Chitinimonas TaxID=240411 RepID=A0ABT8B978_9NEIS|nr:MULTISPECIES: glycine cleavage system protein GcvH [Chitinimonas]MDN3578599.1 glycine cleavage system protein GcvH [Chitinimonas viridis]GLR12509.1 glycine cleavage system H protein [Chitinimonas prasina]